MWCWYFSSIAGNIREPHVINHDDNDVDKGNENENDQERKEENGKETKKGRYNNDTYHMHW